MNATVIMACRAPDRAVPARDQLVAETKVAPSKVKFLLVSCVCFSLLSFF
jgi:hypothetical protein